MRGADRQADLRRWAADFAVATAMGVVLGLIGPFGNFFNGPAWQRIIYWLVMVWLGFAAYCAMVLLILPRARSRRAAWVAAIVMAVLCNGLLTWVSWMLAHAIWPELKQVPWLTPGVWYGEGLVVGVVQIAVFALLLRRRGLAQARSGAPSAAPGLLGAQPAEILCLQMEDHYVRVHTAGGSRLVLATLSQGIEALGRTPGVRVHRSWWVAERAVTGAVADGRNLRLSLINGLSAPVARSSVAAVRQAGWLERSYAAAGETAVRDG